MKSEQRLSKQDLYRAISPMQLFAALAPEQLQDNIVQFACPRCSRRAMTSECGSRPGIAQCSACRHKLTYWDYIQETEKLDNKQTFARLSMMAKASVPGTHAEPPSRQQESSALEREIDCEPASSHTKSAEERSVPSPNPCHDEACRMFLKIGIACMDAGTEYSAAARDYLQSCGFNPSEYKAMEVCVHPGSEYLHNFCRKRGIKPEELKAAGLICESRDYQGWLALPWKDEEGVLTGFVLAEAIAGSSGWQDGAALYAGQQHYFYCDAARSSMQNTGTALVVRNALEVLYMRANGIQNAVALPVWPPTGEALLSLREAGALELTVCMPTEKDDVVAIVKLAQKLDLQTSFLVLPGDVASAAEYIRTTGKAAFLKLLKKTIPGWLHIAKHVVQGVEAANSGQLGVAGKKIVVSTIAGFMPLVPQEMHADLFRTLASDMGISVRDVRELIGSADHDDVPCGSESSAEQEQVGDGEPAEAPAPTVNSSRIISAAQPSEGDLWLTFLTKVQRANEMHRFDIIIDLCSYWSYNYPFPKGIPGQLKRNFMNTMHRKARLFDEVGVSNLLNYGRGPLSQGEEGG